MLFFTNTKGKVQIMIKSKKLHHVKGNTTLLAGELKTDKYPRLALPSVPKDQIEAFSKMVIAGLLIGYHRGVFDVSNEWNMRLPEYKFTKAEELLGRVW